MSQQDFVVTELNAQEINQHWSAAQQVLARWTAVKGSTSLQEVDTFRDDLVAAQHGVETIEDYIEGQVAEWKKRLGAVKLLSKDLKNHDEMAKRHYWALRNAEPKPSQPRA